MSKSNRRKFIKQTGLIGSGIALSSLTGFSNDIIGANDRIRAAAVGLNGRGSSLVKSALSVPNFHITHLCDVDTRAIAKGQQALASKDHKKGIEEEDFRRLLDNKDIDAVIIATPDHWHAPMAIMAAKAGKAVYVEKPCCHNPAEGELLVQVSKKYNAIIQMGNQQRSGFATKEAIQDIRDGIIGTPYMGKAWYANKRGSIGIGKESPIPEWLNWELWQGPAPRSQYMSNYVHYNWHWFWNWGTGEINNNGTHEIDICRYALGVKFPKRVTSSGGRYHFKDDWQFYDTQVANFEFEEGKLITWEGKSCNNMPTRDRGRGVYIHGTEGTALIDRNAYTVWDQNNVEIKFVKEGGFTKTTDTVGGGNLDQNHFLNFANAIRHGDALNAEIEGGYISNLLPHLGNIAQECGGVIDTDPKNGHIIGNEKAQGMWKREYEKGWEPTL